MASSSHLPSNLAFSPRKLQKLQKRSRKHRSSEQISRALTNGTLREPERNGYRMDTEREWNGYRTGIEREREHVQNGNRMRSVKRSLLDFF